MPSLVTKCFPQPYILTPLCPSLITQDISDLGLSISQLATLSNHFQASESTESIPEEHYLFNSLALAARSSLVPSCWMLKSCGIAGPGLAWWWRISTLSPLGSPWSCRGCVLAVDSVLELAFFAICSVGPPVAWLSVSSGLGINLALCSSKEWSKMPANDLPGRHDDWI
jgi:hypothetical protein